MLLHVMCCLFSSWNSIVWCKYTAVYPSIPARSDGHLGVFTIFVIVNKSAVNAPCMFLGERLSACLLGVFLGMELLGQVCMLSAVFDTAQQFPQNGATSVLLRT